MGSMTFLVQKGSETYDMTRLVESVTWSGSKSSAPRTLEVSLVDTDNPGCDRPGINVDNGQTCGFYWDGEELFRGIIMKYAQSSSRKATVTAYDSAIYLANNTDTFVYKKKTATQIFKDICKRFELECDAVDTNHVIKKLTKPNTTAIDAIWEALSRTFKNTGKRYYVVSEKGVIKLIARADNVLQWVFEEGSNLTSYSFERSIEEVRTRVKLYSDANKLLASAKDEDLETRIGIMQHSEQADGKKDKAKLKKMAQKLLTEMKETTETFSLECIGIPEVTSGKAIWVNIPYLGLEQTYYVDEDTHTFTGASHTMSLTLNKVNSIEGEDDD